MKDTLMEIVAQAINNEMDKIYGDDGNKDRRRTICGIYAAAAISAASAVIQTDTSGEKKIDNVVPISNADLRATTLFNAVNAVLLERGRGMPKASIVGVLEFVKQQVMGQGKV